MGLGEDCYAQTDIKGVELYIEKLKNRSPGKTFRRKISYIKLSVLIFYFMEFLLFSLPRKSANSIFIQLSFT
jgi:hypothetical protein